MRENKISPFIKENSIKKKGSMNREINSNSNEMSINYINLNYVQDPIEENKNNNNLAYMSNISKLMRKMEQNKPKVSNTSLKYFKRDVVSMRPNKKKEKTFLEDENKKEIKSYQFFLNIEEKKLDPEDFIRLPKKRNSSIPSHLQLMQKQKQLKKNVFFILLYYY